MDAKVSLAYSSFRLNTMPELKVENDQLQKMVDEMRSRGAGDIPTSQTLQSGSMYATSSLNPLTHASAPIQEMSEPSAPHYPSSVLISGVFNGGASISTDSSEPGKGNIYNPISANLEDHRDEGSKKKKVNISHISQFLSTHTLSAEKSPERRAICLHHLWPHRFSRMEKGLSFPFVVQPVF